MQKLCQLENIGVKHVHLLQNAGIEDQYQLLDLCAERKGRHQLSARTGIHPKLILKWTIEADLCRIKGIGCEFAALLANSGIRSVTDLAEKDSHLLAKTLKRHNLKTPLVKNLPSQNQLESWIQQANSLPGIIHY